MIYIRDEVVNINMVRWNKELYIDDELGESIEDIKHKVEMNRIVLGVYCIVLSFNKDNMLDIMSVNELRQRHYDDITIDIVGVASSKKRAIKLVAKMAEDVYAKTKEYDIKKYFLLTV